MDPPSHTMLAIITPSHHKPGDIHTPASKKEPRVKGPTIVDDFCEDYHNMPQRIQDAKNDIAALEEAKRLTAEFGPTSPEAKQAWETVEELAAAATHHRTTGSG